MIDNFHLPLIDEMDLVTLAGIGFLVLTDSAISIENPAISSAPVELLLPEGKIVIADVAAGKEVTVRCVMLTTTGSELISVLPPVKQAANLPSALIEILSGDGYKNVSYHPSA